MTFPIYEANWSSGQRVQVSHECLPRHKLVKYDTNYDQFGILISMTSPISQSIPFCSNFWQFNIEPINIASEDMTWGPIDCIIELTDSWC